MRKLRNLWTSHKKYCTTITPLRSYTPLSGYPHSRSSYDLDRTYYTSTPNYISRFRRADSLSESSRDDVGGLTRNLSDLSIDKIDDSDDDPVKVSDGNSQVTDVVDRNQHVHDDVVVLVVKLSATVEMQFNDISQKEFIYFS